MRSHCAGGLRAPVCRAHLRRQQEARACHLRRADRVRQEPDEPLRHRRAEGSQPQDGAAATMVPATLAVLMVADEAAGDSFMF